MIREAPVTFAAARRTLEGAAFVPSGAAHGLVVCHPHPEYGGTMDNPVVVGAATEAARSGCATPRFNFRGVGASEGRYSGSFDETVDALAAVRFLRERSGLETLVLAGYSFGAMVACLAADDPQIERLIAIALPATMFDPACVIRSAKPKLFLHGDRDQYCPHGVLQDLVAKAAGPASLQVLAGADHFFAGHEAAIGSRVARFVREGS
jgi:hypothetical protein